MVKIFYLIFFFLALSFEFVYPNFGVILMIFISFCLLHDFLYDLHRESKGGIKHGNSKPTNKH
jgi:hypothetical protein